MNNNTPAMTGKNSVKAFFGQDFVKQKFNELLGTRAPAFLTSVLQVAASNDMLAGADPVSIFNSAAVAATLNLPLNNSLGLAYIVPYKAKQQDGSYKTVAQFQLGYKGFKQLALRSGQFKIIHATDVREGEIKKHDRLTGEIDFEWIKDTATRDATPVVGFCSYFKLINGFEQTFYMTLEELKKHGAKYSKTFNNKNGLWSTDEAGMCIKTVIKLNLSKNAPLSIDMQTAVRTDQAVINDVNAESVSYVDNDKDNSVEISHDEVVEKKLKQKLKDCKTISEVDDLQVKNPDHPIDEFVKRKKEIADGLQKKTSKTEMP